MTLPTTITSPRTLLPAALLLAVGLQDRLQLRRPGERAAIGELAGRIDEDALIHRAAAADGIELLERETQRVHAVVAGSARGIEAVLFEPLTLRRMNIDPALGGGVVLTTVTDVMGFFAFLGLATLVLLR